MWWQDLRKVFSAQETKKGPAIWLSRIQNFFPAHKTIYGPTYTSPLLIYITHLNMLTIMRISMTIEEQLKNNLLWAYYEKYCDGGMHIENWFKLREALGK